MSTSLVGMEQGHAIDLSILVPMHNAMAKMGRCVDSLREADELLRGGGFRTQVLFVDDCSDDGSFEALETVVSGRDSWSVTRLSVNSGSPSRPRNTALADAVGRYVFFLDGDDAVNGLGLLAAVKQADEFGHDTVRGPVVVEYVGENKRITVDSLAVPEDASVDDMMRLIGANQSLTCTALWRRDFLLSHGMWFDETSRMGEDVVFTATAILKCSSIGYVAENLFRYVRMPGGGGSSMHNFGGREIRELVNSWQLVEDAFAERGLSYLELHGDRTVNYALRQIIRYHVAEEIGPEDIEVFADFFVRHRVVLKTVKLGDPHVRELVDALSLQGSSAFWEGVKPRLLIAGHDLKFILSAVPDLRRWFVVRVDEWATEVLHDEARSRQALAWADYVWVEWLTSAAVWYASRVGPTQRLVVRVHRYELGRNYGDQIDFGRISGLISIAPHCHEDLIERFSIERSKVHFIPNFYRVDDYAQADPSDDSRVFSLALIGAIPRRKGLLKALQLLKMLREVDSRYSLSLLGKRVDELPWVAWDPHEQQYFEACESFVESNGLSGAVDWVGWQDARATAKDYGFVLSTSEHEGSHVGPGEAYCAGNQGIFLRWRGAEFVYPERQVFDSLEEMCAYILSMRDLAKFNAEADRGRAYMRQTYDISLFLDRVRRVFRGVE